MYNKTNEIKKEEGNVTIKGLQILVLYRFTGSVW